MKTKKIFCSVIISLFIMTWCGVSVGGEITLQQLIDEREVLELIYQYGYNFDSKNPDGVVQLFTEDCVFEVLEPDGKAAMRHNGRDPLRAFFDKRMKTVLADRETRHHKLNTVYEEVTPNKIITKTMVLTVHIIKGGKGPHVAHSRNIEHEFSKDSGEWLIKRRTIRK